MDLEQIMATDDFKTLSLEEQIRLVITKTPIWAITHTIFVGNRKAAEMTHLIMKLIEVKQ